MSCCGNNNYYSRSCEYYSKPAVEAAIYNPCCNTGCTCNTACNCNNACNCNSCCSINNCPYNDCAETCCGDTGVSGAQCFNSLKESLCRLVNQKAIINIGGCRVCVIISTVCQCFVKAVSFTTGRVLYFNMNRIDSVEDILP